MVVKDQRHSHVVIEVIVGWHMEDVISANLTYRIKLFQDLLLNLYLEVDPPPRLCM